VTSAAIYARVSSTRQKKDQTIGSQTCALREHAVQNRLEVPAQWVFEDEGHSGATLVRPGLEALRDLAAGGCLDVVLVYSPDRLARKFAYQALLIEEFARAGTRVEFISNGARGDSPEDQLLVQFQGMFAEYEKAQLAERYRRGKAHRARAGSVSVLSRAPFGYRYVPRTDLAGAAEPDADIAGPLNSLAMQLEVQAREWFLAEIVLIGLADGSLSDEERHAARVIAAHIGMTPAQAFGVIAMTEEDAPAG